MTERVCSGGEFRQAHLSRVTRVFGLQLVPNLANTIATP